MFNAIQTTLKLYAFEAIAKAEARAREFVLVQGRALIGPEKEDMAVGFVVGQYKASTAFVPILNATDIDDKLVESEARDAVRWVFGQIGSALNVLSREPVVDDPTLPEGGPS